MRASHISRTFARHLPWIKQFALRQQRFIAIAVAIYAALWAVDRWPDISVTLAFALPLCNLDAASSETFSEAPVTIRMADVGINSAEPSRFSHALSPRRVLELASQF